MSETALNAKDCRPMAKDAALDEPGQYAPEWVVSGPDGFAGEYLEATNYRSEDGTFVVRLWQCEAGVLQAGNYPFDEYFLVLEGRVIVTNRRTGTVSEYGPGDTGMLTKGGNFTWDMPVRFLKQYVRMEK
ncbi:MAG TPA: cupin domain-containing protein [Pseudonocardia sp.]|jgi:uncharacterized cupin superfamily protein|nr:cupin domain-containing protein [Pseudonocardia sp.]